MTKKLLALFAVIGSIQSNFSLAQEFSGFVDEKGAAKEIAQKTIAAAPQLKQIFIRPFDVPGGGENYELPRLIKEALEKNGITVERGAQTEMKGDLVKQYAKDANGKLVLNKCVIEIELRGVNVAFFNVNGQEKRSLPVPIAGADSVRTLVGGTESFVAPPESKKPTNPRILPVGYVVPEPGSPYRVEFLVKRNGRYEIAKVIKNKAGLDVVKVNRGDVVGLRLHNDSGYEIAADVRVDGVSRYVLSQFSNHLDLVPPGKHRDILGYVRTKQIAAEFTVGAFEDSVANELGQQDPGSAQSFTIAFRHSWTDPKHEPPGEPASSKSGVGIVPGDHIDQGLRIVKRLLGTVRATVQIHYEQ